MIYKKGDVVGVYSLQSFHNGGFLRGARGVVHQDQHGESGSVLVEVIRNIGGKMKLDKSYEVYPEQLRPYDPRSDHQLKNGEVEAGEIGWICSRCKNSISPFIDNCPVCADKGG